MKRVLIAVGAVAVVLLLLIALALGLRNRRPFAVAPPSTGAAATTADAPAGPATQVDQGFLYGRVTTTDGATHLGRLRWGGGEEAFWSDYFNATKVDNPWAALVSPGRLPVERHPFELFGVELGVRETPADLSRPFVARFGDVTRIEADGGDLRVTLKSGTRFELDRYAADDLADGVRVWDASGVVDLGERRIRSIELLPTAGFAEAPRRLHGTVHTRRGAFTGFLQWNREDCVDSDELVGRGTDGEVSLRFASIRSIARHADDAVRVTRDDGSEVVLSGTSDSGQRHGGIYVDDPRYGRALVSWEAFVRLDLNGDSGGDGSGDGSGPAYGDFPPGSPLTGSVTTRDGRRLAGRLVYDLDESETTETLDAPLDGVTYTIPFALVATIVPGGGGEPARLTLHSGEELSLEPDGDLGAGNAGILVFVEAAPSPEYVPWSDVARIDLQR